MEALLEHQENDAVAALMKFDNETQDTKRISYGNIVETFLVSKIKRENSIIKVSMKH